MFKVLDVIDEMNTRFIKRILNATYPSYPFYPIWIIWIIWISCIWNAKYFILLKIIDNISTSSTSQMMRMMSPKHSLVKRRFAPTLETTRFLGETHNSLVFTFFKHLMMRFFRNNIIFMKSQFSWKEHGDSFL